MKLYYTTIVKKDNEQKNASLSLGGFKSSTPVPNGVFENFFSDVSAMSVQNNSEEYIACMLKNETGSDQDVSVWFDYPENSLINIEISAVDLNNDMMENIDNSYQVPLYADFVEANGEPNAVSLGNIPTDGVIGIWFKKTINLDVVKTIESDDYLIDNYEKESIKKQSIELSIKY